MFFQREKNDYKIQKKTNHLLKSWTNFTVQFSYRSGDREGSYEMLFSQ